MTSRVRRMTALARAPKVDYDSPIILMMEASHDNQKTGP